MNPRTRPPEIGRPSAAPAQSLIEFSAAELDEVMALFVDAESDVCPDREWWKMRECNEVLDRRVYDRHMRES